MNATLRIPSNARLPSLQGEKLIRELNFFPNESINIVDPNDVSVAPVAPRIVEKRFKSPNFADPDVSAKDLGHHAGYYTIQHSHDARIDDVASIPELYQKSIELLILKLPFKRLVHEITQDFKQLAYTMEVNEKLDVYSFGVLILEVLMGKHPGNLISSLSSSPPTVYGVLLKDILDMRRPSPGNHVEEELVLVVKLALACLHTSPQCQQTMRQISVALSKQRPPLQNSFHLISLGQLFDVKCSTS
ncbi:unnamed protein product [Camellia sinensis]